MTAILFVFHYYMGLNTEDEQYDTVHRQFTIQEDMTKNEADNYIHQILQDKKMNFVVYIFYLPIIL